MFQFHYVMLLLTTILYYFSIWLFLYVVILTLFWNVVLYIYRGHSDLGLGLERGRSYNYIIFINIKLCSSVFHTKMLFEPIKEFANLYLVFKVMGLWNDVVYSDILPTINFVNTQRFGSTDQVSWLLTYSSY